MKACTLGLDYGTNSVRALIVETATGAELGTSVFDFPHGEAGVLLDPNDPNVARQHPQDYLDGLIEAAKGALHDAAAHGVSGSDVIGIGVDTTGSTPIPLDADGAPLAFNDAFADHPAAMAWLWKDHTGHVEAMEISARAAELRPQYLAKCGGTYSSEWFWAKVLHCQRTAPEVFAAAATWVEHADWIPAILTGKTAPNAIQRCICAAGHKAMFHTEWGGYPDAEFLATLDPALVSLRQSLPNEAITVADTVGTLTPQWADALGLTAGIPVAGGAFDAHLGAVGSGIGPGTLVKIIGTSGCDMAVASLDQILPDIPGLCGIVPGSILPDCYGLEAGQSAVGDIFNWYVNRMQPGGAEAGSHDALTHEAEQLSPGESGLLALDWHNGNRTVLVDPRLTGLVLGLSLHTRPAEIYRALMEATAFGARIIMERFEEYGITIERIVNCGGISAKNPMVMQIYADVMNRPLGISRSTQTCALGAAMAGSVVAGSNAGGHDDFAAAARAMSGLLETQFTPDPARAAVYQKLFSLYRRLHDIFGTRNYAENQFDVMKSLLEIRDDARAKQRPQVRV